MAKKTFTNDEVVDILSLARTHINEEGYHNLAIKALKAIVTQDNGLKLTSTERKLTRQMYKHDIESNILMVTALLNDGEVPMKKHKQRINFCKEVLQKISV